MLKKNMNKTRISVLFLLFLGACKAPSLVEQHANSAMPSAYSFARDTASAAYINWRDYFKDPQLQALIDTALQNNQELRIFSQEIQIAQNEVMARKGEYLPFVQLGGGAGFEKSSRYTVMGATEKSVPLVSGKEIPDPVPDFMVTLRAAWEVDIWKKLRNARKAAAIRYLGTQEGRNFLITQLVAEIAASYYELLALDNQLAIVRNNIQIQQNALSVVRLQKEAARVTELAVKRFEAELYKNQGLQYDLKQRIVETENRINFLTRRFPQPIVRNPQAFNALLPDTIRSGLPAQLLVNRPDIRQAELEMEASKLDVQVARANFLPGLRLTAALGNQALTPGYFFKLPESLVLGLAGELVGPLINKNAIKANYNSANARQKQAIIHYEQTILNACIEVSNQLANLDNLQNRYNLKQQQVQALNESVAIAGQLFNGARADYVEVLLTQRDALEARMDLVETQMAQLHAWVGIYRALGGGWK
ncbi:MAG: efflux transporter outer membrane subunit [Bacteroidetes bacterium]|nr:efflux transporter outer membrane subunit [Bacteroidota bacterium]